MAKTKRKRWRRRDSQAANLTTLYTLKKRDSFLAAYAVCGVITDAAVAAGCSRLAHYYWLEHDPEYPALFRLADGQALDALIKEARRQALDGINEPVIHQGKLCGHFVDMRGRPVNEGDPTAEVFVPLTVNKKNPVLLMFLINRHDKRESEQIAREREESGAGMRDVTPDQDYLEIHQRAQGVREISGPDRNATASRS
jgi:hypothetical protein